MELSESMQNQYGKQYKGGPTPGKNKLNLIFLYCMHTNIICFELEPNKQTIKLLSYGIGTRFSKYILELI